MDQKRLNYSVRKLKPKDIPRYLALTKINDRESDFLGSSPEDPRISPMQLMNSISTGRMVIFVIELNGQLVGQLGMYWRRSRNKKLGHCMNLGLAVMKDYWGYGMGTSLMQACEDWAKMNQIVRLELEVVCQNEPAVALYKKCGYDIEGTKRKSMYIDGEYFDEYLMAKILI